MVRLVFSVFFAVSVLFCSEARAGVYDDFSGENIDLSRWTIQSTPGSPPGLFTQSKEGEAIGVRSTLFTLDRAA
jgi:hypothetical protein